MSVLQPNPGWVALPEKGCEKALYSPWAIWARTEARVRPIHLGPWASPQGQLAGRHGATGEPGPAPCHSVNGHSGWHRALWETEGLCAGSSIGLNTEVLNRSPWPVIIFFSIFFLTGMNHRHFTI